MLRTRLMLALMLLLIMLLSMGLYSIDECSQLGKKIEAVSRDHDPAGRGIAAMKHACFSMISAALEGAPTSPEKFSTASSHFDKALAEEQGRAQRSAEEKSLDDQLGTAYAAYKSEALALAAARAQPSPGVFHVRPELGTATAALLDTLERLTLAHEHATRPDGQDGAKEVNRTVRFLELMMIMALAATIIAAMGLNRGLVDPLRTLTTSIQQVGEGNLDQQVPVLDSYELGVLSKSFNRMAAQLKEYRAQTSVELMRLNLTIRSTLASFPDPIFVLNSEGAVQFRNPEADQLAVQLLFAGVTRLPKIVDEKVEDVLKTGKDYLPSVFRDAIKFHLGGHDRYFLPRIVLLRDENRETFGVAVILEDVTRMLLLDDVKSNLISTVSHELKTPLTSVRMALYLLVEKTVGSLNDKQMDLCLTAREDADRLLRTLNDLLDLAKLEQGPAQLNLELSSPEQLVTDAVRAARESPHSLEIENAPDLPPVNVDRQRIAYVFSNLITNAQKYSAPGAAIKISAGTGTNRAGRPAVRFSVRDEGPGIPPEHQEHIFERFYRVPGTSQNGAGLGLSIAREIVVAHQGEMGVVSSPGMGSEFYFLLPLGSEA